jgi:Protein of unknown function (DUF3703)
MNTFRERIRSYIEHELEQAKILEAAGQLEQAFSHLERAHVLGQQDTHWHVTVHQTMLAFATRHKDAKEMAGQLLRIAGAVTKTPLGIVPTGNTGGANVSPIKPMPIAADLQAILDKVQYGD